MSRGGDPKDLTQSAQRKSGEKSEKDGDVDRRGAEEAEKAVCGRLA